MNIGILGTGNVGSALARGFEAAGHDVVLGSRNPQAARDDFYNGGNDLEFLGQREAAEYGDVVVLGLPSSVVVDVATDLREALAGKAVIDATNEYPTASSDRSLAERIADAAPDARVVKAFNTIGAERMADPEIGGEAATMFVAGAATDERDTVAALAADLGFEAVVAGDLSNADHLENLARFWIHLSQTHGRDVAFRLLRE